MPFIVIEGIDGSGKSTQVAALCEYLKNRGGSVEYLHFPRFDAPVYGSAIARFLRGEMGRLKEVDPQLVSLLFAGDRLAAAPIIRGWLAEGKWVVTDRYVFSNVAYQCAKVADPQALMEWILELEYGLNDIPRPDVSIFLDVPWSFTESRLLALREGDDRDYLEGKADIHEASLGFQRRVREAYLELAERGFLTRVDCADKDGEMDTPENNFSRIITVIHDEIQ